mgnify:CR=1 FL=1|tara:strand:+ start:653 stop:1435 length:783 start_codon:yes stop_codon:yes gene_type:complete
MADGKKSFILYCDLIHVVKKLPKDKAGELLVTILEYVNDLNPVVQDFTVDLVFEPIKQQLKRDLIKWDGGKPERVKKARNAGVASGEARRNKSNSVVQDKLGSSIKPELNELNELPSSIQNKQNQLVTPNNELNELGATKRTANVSVNVNANVSGNVITSSLEEIGSEKVKEVANEVWKDQSWREQVCMGLSLKMDELQRWLAMFNSSVSNDKIADFDKGTYKKMSRGWIAKQKSRGVTVESNGVSKKSEAAPLSYLKQD